MNKTKKNLALNLPNDLIIENEDCFKFLNKVSNESVDLVLIDPPYEISRKTGFESVVNGVDRFAISMDFGEWDKEFLGLEIAIKEFYRILKNTGTVIIFYDLWKITTLSEYLKQAKFKQLRFIEWIKTNPVPINSKINYLTNAREIAVTAVKGGKPKFNSLYDRGIYEHPIYHSKDRSHPTQKPVKLFEELIEKHSSAGDTVLDCFLGSGTTAIAARNKNRKFLGCEIDEKFFNLTIERLYE